LLPLEIEFAPYVRLQSLSSTIDLALEHSLSVYDAAYLQLASQHRLALATLDTGLRKAGEKLGVPLLPARF
jgi:predicted nucleic acid-binding protein